MAINQNIKDVVNISDWRVDEEYRQYPEGARSKALLYAPANPPYSFLRSNFPYLFKLSSHRYPEQFWVEIFAYRLGCQVGIEVPKAFVAINTKKDLSGALIEWFFEPGSEILKPGGDFFVDYIPGFERKKGKQHNFETITRIFEDLARKYPDLKDCWLRYWVRIFVFDALIGNTDRHQDNWGIILNKKEHAIRFAPAFDNGTSLGHEIRSEKFYLAKDKKWLDLYVSRGYHHVRWRLDDVNSAGHFELLEKICLQFPESKQEIVDMLCRVKLDNIMRIIEELCFFEVPVRLSQERAAFMLTLIEARYNKIRLLLER